MFITVVKQTIESTHMETAVICIERAVVLPRCNLHSGTDSISRGHLDITNQNNTRVFEEFPQNHHILALFCHPPRQNGSHLMKSDKGSEENKVPVKQNS